MAKPKPLNIKVTFEPRESGEDYEGAVRAMAAIFRPAVFDAVEASGIALANARESLESPDPEAPDLTVQKRIAELEAELQALRAMQSQVTDETE